MKKDIIKLPRIQIKIDFSVCACILFEHFKCVRVDRVNEGSNFFPGIEYSRCYMTLEIVIARKCISIINEV